MASNIRKIALDLIIKTTQCHYAVGQQVYGGHEISHILFEENDSSYNIHIKKHNEVLPWKKLILTWQYPLSMI